MNCLICNKPYEFSWTDTHGVAQCTECGTPYRIYHYDENDKRVEKPPELLLLPEFVDLCREYYQTTHRVMPGGHSFPGGQELATSEDARAFNEWMKRRIKSKE